MKKFMCLMAAVLFMTGCTQGVQPAEAEITTEGITVSETEADTFAGFRTGKWKCENGGRVKYYYFDGDGRTGRLLDPETNMGFDFEYELDGKNAVFYMGAADDMSPAVVKAVDDSCVEISWENGDTELLTYIGNDSGEETATN